MPARTPFCTSPPDPTSPASSRPSARSPRPSAPPQPPSPQPFRRSSMRRVVTGHDSTGRAVVVDDGTPPRTHDFASYPGFRSSLVWATEPDARASRVGEDPTGKVENFLPRPGGSRLIVLTL